MTTPKPATELPWVINETYGQIGSVCNQSLEQQVLQVSELHRDEANSGRIQNTEYIVHACNTLPTLQARIAKLEEALETIKSSTFGWTGLSIRRIAQAALQSEGSE